MPKRKPNLTINHADDTTLLIDADESSEEGLQNSVVPQTFSGISENTPKQLSDLPNDIWGVLFKMMYRDYEREAKNSILSLGRFSDYDNGETGEQLITRLQNKAFKDFFSNILNLRAVNKTWNQSILNQADFQELSRILAQYPDDVRKRFKSMGDMSYKNVCINYPSMLLCLSLLTVAITIMAGLGIDVASHRNETGSGSGGGMFCCKRGLGVADMDNTTQSNSTNITTLSSPPFVLSLTIEGSLFLLFALYKLIGSNLDRRSNRAVEQASQEKQAMRNRFAAYGLFASNQLPKVELVLEDEKNSLKS